jgi:MoaA/NifB/PqqE/SkfB family radical SAM enzyme
MNNPAPDKKDSAPAHKGSVLFIAPPILLPRIFAHYPTFSNIGMLYNAALLEREGYRVEVLDAFFLEKGLNYRPATDELYYVGAEEEAIRAALKAKTPDVVIIVITMFSDVHKLDETYIRHMAEEVRKTHPGAYLMAADCYVCGMNYFPYDPVELLKQIPALDCVVVGEADHKLRDVIRSARSGRPPESIAQVTYRRNGEPTTNPGTYPPATDLDDLPYPAFHLLDMDNYFASMDDAVRVDLVHEYHTPERFLPLMTSRGCKFFCNFCTQQVLRMPWRGHSVEYLKEMILHFRKKYDIERFLFIDNNINLDPDRFVKLIRFMSNEGIPWDAVNGFRADLLTDEAIELIQKAGNAKITVSAESGDPKVLEGVVHKRLDLKHVVRVAKKSKEVGIPSQVHYVIGIPGETRKQINNTLHFAAMLYEYHGSWPLVQHAIPFRQTALFRDCETRKYFTTHPDSVPGYELEKRSLIKTEAFTPEEVMRFKHNFRRLLDAMDTICVLDLNTGCNNNCVHCEIAGLKDRTPTPVEELGLLLKERRSRGARDILIKGGEPLLEHETALDLIRRGRDLGYYRVSLATNGRMLAYKRFARDLVESGLNTVNISVHSPGDETHDAVTRVEGSHAQTLQGIRNLRDLGFNNIDVTIRFTALNIDTLEETVHFLLRMGLRSIHLRGPVPLHRVADNPHLIVSYAESLPVLSRILAGTPDADIMVQGVPFCLFDHAFLHRLMPLPFFNFPQIRPLKAKQERCLECTEFVTCLGFWRERFEPFFKQDEAFREGNKDADER